MFAFTAILLCLGACSATESSSLATGHPNESLSISQLSSSLAQTKGLWLDTWEKFLRPHGPWLVAIVLNYWFLSEIASQPRTEDRDINFNYWWIVFMVVCNAVLPHCYGIGHKRQWFEEKDAMFQGLILACFGLLQISTIGVLLFHLGLKKDVKVWVIDPMTDRNLIFWDIIGLIVAGLSLVFIASDIRQLNKAANILSLLE